MYDAARQIDDLGALTWDDVEDMIAVFIKVCMYVGEKVNR